MLSQEDTRKIQKLEEDGGFVAVIGGNGELQYATNSVKSEGYCDCCECLRFLPDPDPFDWFRDGDMKAVCTAINGVIAGHLETPKEYVNIEKPLFCPKLGRKLSKEEKEKADKMLKIAKSRME